MGFLKNALIAVGAIVGGSLLVKGIQSISEENERAYNEEQKRKSLTCLFNDGVSQEEFVEIVNAIVKTIKRVTVSINGPVVTGTVRSQSGISTWKFQLDFNDYGHLTGRYWITNENKDSQIPESLAQQIQKRIKG